MSTAPPNCVATEVFTMLTLTCIAGQGGGSDGPADSFPVETRADGLEHVDPRGAAPDSVPLVSSATMPPA